ncbi:M15 family metallopeptidase [Acidaminococcus massiliensis]|uniref:M15 family metallopeptidase n=1 Tax=Acidaminococcus massiliensis TaxID=1852375 RepID=UPI00248EB8E3|nr:M15 family metallopeptidase [Acidaminococcus massiliensis]
MYKKTGILALCLVWGLSLTAWAGAWEPEELNREVAALVGFYQGNGEQVAVRENKGKLQLLYRFLPNDRDYTGSNVYTLVKNHYDNYDLREVGPNTDAGSTIRFDRDKNGLGISLNLGQKSYTRKFTGGENGKPIRVTPAQPLEELRKEAAAAALPSLPYDRTADLVDLSQTVPGLQLDLRYTTENNLFGAPLVLSRKALLDRNAAQALARVQAGLKPYGYGLVVWEAYRSWQDFKLATLALGKDHAAMLPKAEEGYSHNSGRSIDVSLYDLETGEPAAMISDFDEPSPAQYAQFAGGTQKQRYLRDLLRQQMTLQGFTASDMEWWHFDYDAGNRYQVLNQ